MELIDAATLDHRLTQGTAVEGADLSQIDWQERSYEDPVFVNCRFSASQFTAPGWRAADSPGAASCAAGSPRRPA
jgi:hypothetical protein